MRVIGKCILGPVARCFRSKRLGPSFFRSSRIILSFCRRSSRDVYSFWLLCSVETRDIHPPVESYQCVRDTSYSRHGDSFSCQYRAQRAQKLVSFALERFNSGWTFLLQSAMFTQCSVHLLSPDATNILPSDSFFSGDNNQPSLTAPLNKIFDSYRGMVAHVHR